MQQPEERLRYYASQFPLVEVDSSYYAMPKPEVAELWAKRTPPDFTFNITGIQFKNGVEVRSQGRRKVAA